VERLSASEDSTERAVPALLAGTGGLLLLAALAMLPEVLSLYWVRVLTGVLLFAAMAQSINIIAGFVGYPAFGNVVFFGLGAYGAAVAMLKLHAHFLVGLGLGLLLCSIVVLVIGPPLLRLRGHYFAIATLGLNEAIKAIVNNLTELTGGGTGLSLPILDAPVIRTAALFYRAFLTLAAIGVATTLILRTSRFGFACRAIRANEEGAASLGINPTFYKTAAWLISALLAGAAGALYARWLSYIEPSSVFDMTISVKAFVMFLLGGAGTVIGPVVGAAIVEIVTTLTWGYWLNYHLAVLGVIIMAAAVLMPRGFHAFLRDRLSSAVSLLRRGG
jgi:branched-chain amino acid transport system permease protein